MSLEEFIQEFCTLNILQVLLTCISAHPPFVGKVNKDIDLPFQNLNLTPLKNEIDACKQASLCGYAKNEHNGPYIFLAMHVRPASLKELLEDNEIAHRHQIRRLIKEYFREIPAAQYQTIMFVYGLVL